MRFNRLDLNLLVALDALLTERNISRAAEKVHLSQSTMSHALGRLREHFKDDLLVQVGRKMELTPRAETLRDPIRDVLVQISITVDTPVEFDPSRSDREFVLHVSDYSMEVLLPHVFALAGAQGSKSTFRLLPQSGPVATRALERGEVDVLLTPEGYCSPDHPSEALFQEEFVAVVWRESRIATVELTMDRYINAQHVVMEPIGFGQQAYDGWMMQRYGISRHVSVTTYSFSVLPHMVVGTEMIATLHTRLARHAARALPVKILPLPLEVPPLVQAVQWHKHRSNDPALIWLRNLLKQATARMDGETPQ